MSSRTIGLLLLVVNLALLGIIVYLVREVKRAPLTAPVAEKVTPVTNKVISVRKFNATNLLEALAAARISWAQIESTNYPIYILNLRALGCPEQTIRDIILTDVAKMYAERRAAVRAQAPQPKFWMTGDAWEVGSTDPQVRQYLRALEQEQQALVRELLGVDFLVEMSKYFDDDTSQERQYGFLPPDKRDQVARLQARYDEAEQDYYERTKGILTDDDERHLKALQKQREQELAQLLTPEQFEEYQLRNSATAQEMRLQMAGFQPSEEEFRKIFQAQKSFDDQFNQTIDTADDAQAEARARAQAEAQQALNNEVRKVLGDQRFAEYERAQDVDYRSLSRMAERFQFPQEVAGRVYDMKVAAERQRQVVEGNPNLSDDQKLAALLAIARATERSVSQTLGADMFKAYQRNGADWLRDLTQSAAWDTLTSDPANAPSNFTPALPPAPPGFPPLLPGSPNPFPPGVLPPGALPPGAVPPTR